MRVPGSRLIFARGLHLLKWAYMPYSMQQKIIHLHSNVHPVLVIGHAIWRIAYVVQRHEMLISSELAST